VKFGEQIYSLKFIFETRNPNNMVYRAIGVMSGSALEGLDIIFAEFHISSGAWQYTVQAAECYPYTDDWREKIRTAGSLSSIDYLALHAEFGHYIGEQVNRFIEAHQLQYKVQLVVSHGHISFHLPEKKLTAQLGEGASIAAVTGINVVSDLRVMDVALGGKGAPLFPLGEKLLFSEYACFLNIGSIANITFHEPGGVIAFDVCPANRILNMLAAQSGKAYDDGGKMAKAGEVKPELLKILNGLEYYSMPYPKSLTSDFASDVIYPLVRGAGVNDAMRTVVEHIAVQTANAVSQLNKGGAPLKLLITGGGANNSFLVSRIQSLLEPLNVEAVLPDPYIVDFKESLVVALLGILRWREENSALAEITGASRDSIGGAVWIGQDA
jgi:anhydro-N-acetylmuramic acid kinase